MKEFSIVIRTIGDLIQVAVQAPEAETRAHWVEFGNLVHGFVLPCFNARVPCQIVLKWGKDSREEAA